MTSNEIKYPIRKWKCFKCHSLYPNTLLYCPKCDIARKHSNRLLDKFLAKESRKKQLEQKHKDATLRSKKIRVRHKR